MSFENSKVKINEYVVRDNQTPEQKDNLEQFPVNPPQVEETAKPLVKRIVIEKGKVLNPLVFQEMLESGVSIIEVEQNGKISRIDLTTGTQEKMRADKYDRRYENRMPKEKNYGWAFFVASMFMGIGITEVTGIDGFVLFGMGFGFLFFVKPIYEKVMSAFEDKKN